MRKVIRARRRSPDRARRRSDSGVMARTAPAPGEVMERSRPAGTMASMAAHLAQVLVHDPDLAGGLEGERLRRAERELVAGTAVAFEGPWEPEESGESVRGGN